jgi:hypothetical protein
MNITHPWVIVHQPGGTGPLVTVLAGPDNAPLEAFAMIAADLVKHISNATGAANEEVMRLVLDELQRPTSSATRMVDA